MERAVKKTELYDVIKTITSILVVIGHIAIMYTASGAIETGRDSLFLEGVSNYIYAFHMPLFILLSGCVYGYCIENGKYQNKIEFIQKKMKKLVVPYLVFGVCYVSPVVVLLKLTELNFIEYVKEAIVLSFNPRHLWYLLVLFWIFLLYILMSPLLCKSIKELTIAGIISIFIFVFWEKFPMHIQIRTACIYQMFFFCGILVNRYYEKLQRFIKKSTFMIIVWPLVLSGIFIYNPNGVTSYMYKFVGIIMMFYLGWYLLEKKPNVIKNSWYKKIQTNSFGIYLLHPMIVYVLFFVSRESQVNPLLLSIGIFILVMVLSLIISELLKKSSLRWIIGE